MATNFNWVDYIFLAVFFISIIGGFARGGVREIVSVLTWLAAFVVASLFAKPVAAYFSHSEGVQSALSSVSSSSTFGISAADQVSMFALGASFAGLFFVTIIAGSLVGYFANTAIEGGGVSIANRLVGGLFGLIRGALIVLVMIFIVQLTPVGQQNFWGQSTLVNYFQPGVQWLGNLVEPGLQSLKAQVGQTLQNMTNGMQKSF